MPQLSFKLELITFGRTCAIDLFVYLDGILIFSKTREVYIQHVQSVLQRLRENSCQGREVFHASSVAFLRSVVNKGHRQMEQEKVSAVTTWCVPENR